MNIYLAGPLFTLGEQLFNRRLADALNKALPQLTVVLPQERAKMFLKQPDAFELIFADCLDMVARCDALVAILDGPDADSGTCIELGYAYARRKPIIGVRTDLRASEVSGLNLMVAHICGTLIVDTSGDLDSLTARIGEALGKLRS